MTVSRWSNVCAIAGLLAGPGAAYAAGEQVVIGDIDDMSGVYADVEGAGGVEAINMAIADFGGTLLGRKISVLSADHQNKPDIGASKFREWADQQGLNLLLGGSNTGVNIAMAKVGVGQASKFMSQNAIQLHGGIGMTEEYAVGHYFRRCMVIEHTFGDTAHHLSRLAEQVR